MDSTDRQLLDIAQKRFPVVEGPYRELGEQLGISEDEALRRVAELKRVGVIRRIGATFDPRKLGHVSTLVACRVPADRVDEFAEVVNAYAEVTHNYQRDHEYNVWFTIIAPSAGRVSGIIDEIKERTGVEDLHNLPAVRLYKIDVTFALGAMEQGIDRRDACPARGSTALRPGSGQAAVGAMEQGIDRRDACPTRGSTAPPPSFSREEISAVRALQGDLPACPRPYERAAAAEGLTEAELLRAAESMKAAGVIRRLGAIVRHVRAGVVGNVMIAWSPAEERADEVGAILASFPEVTHCYERPAFPGFPYTHYTMVHGSSPSACAETVGRMADATGGAEHVMLPTKRELKRTSPVYFPDGA